MANYLQNNSINQEVLNQNQVQNLNSENSIMTVNSNNLQFTSKTGYFYIEISGDGKTTRRLISVQLSSTDMTKEQTVKFNEVAIDGYSDNHNFQIITSVSKTQRTSDYYTILTMDFTYNKPAHYMANGEYSNKVDGYRFNFKEYSLENTGNTTVNNTGHNISDTTEKISLQINVANCGINQISNQYVAKRAMGIINLSKKCYSLLQINPNGGIHDGKNSTYNFGTKLCTTTVTITKPTRKGYEFTGWNLSKGSYCTGAKFDSTNNKFTYCGESTTTSNISANNTCILKANWSKIYGSITIKILNEQKKGLKNGKYTLYDNNDKLIQTIDSGTNSEVKFENLPVGLYTIYENKVQNGYELIKSNPIKVEITNTNNKITVELIHKTKLVLPEAGGISLDFSFYLLGITLIIIFKKKRRNK